MSTPVILLVDDELHVLNALKRVFRKEGYEILSTTEPKEALNILQEREIDVIISDQRMPEMSGVEVLTQARIFRPDTIRMMLTGYADLRGAEDAINKGEVWRFFLKPWNDEDLKSTVRQAILQGEMRHENRRLLAMTRQQNQALRRRGEILEEQVEVQSKQLEETQAKLVQTEKLASLGLLAGGIAHEINNPLGGILTMTQLLLEDVPETSSMHADLKEIEAAALHSKAVVENLLQFARQGRESRIGVTRLKDVLDHVYGLIGHSLDIKNVQLLLEIPSNLPPAWGDPNRLQQVFMNLIGNAGQAMPGGGVIRVVSGVDADKEEIWVKVIDNGVGIPADVMPNIFDPFFTTKPEGEGTGLGLSVTYGIIRDHGGSIEVQSESGKGATFTVHLPSSAPDFDQDIAPVDEKNGMDTKSTSLME